MKIFKIIIFALFLFLSFVYILTQFSLYYIIVFQFDIWDMSFIIT